MQKLTFILLFILMLPNFAQAWPGKIVAVDSANTFIILKEGQTPVKVQLAGVSPARDMVSAKSRLDSSNIVLMKDVDVRELGESSENIILGDITLDGKSLAKELLDEGVVQSTAQTSEKTLSAPEEAPAASMQKPAADSSETTDKLLAGNANDILSELSSEQDEIEPAPEITNQQQAHISSPAPAVQMQRQMPQVRYVQVYQQPQPLGLWPARPVQTSSAVAVSQPMTQQHQELAAQTLPTASSQGTAQSSEMQSPGDISKKDYELAVKVQKKAKRRERTGFFVPKKKHETFLGASAGIQAPVKPKSNVPYSDIGTMDGVMVSHFFLQALVSAETLVCCAVPAVQGQSGEAIPQMQHLTIINLRILTPIPLFPLCFTDFIPIQILPRTLLHMVDSLFFQTPTLTFIFPMLHLLPEPVQGFYINSILDSLLELTCAILILLALKPMILMDFSAAP